MDNAEILNWFLLGLWTIVSGTVGYAIAQYKYKHND